MEKFRKIKAIVDAAEIEVYKYYKKGNKSAGVRLRKVMNDIRRIAQAIRMEILEDNKKRL